MATSKSRRRAPDFQGNAPSEIEQLAGQLDQEITLPIQLLQAAFVGRRFAVPPASAALIAALAFSHAGAAR